MRKVLSLLSIVFVGITLSASTELIEPQTSIEQLVQEQEIVKSEEELFKEESEKLIKKLLKSKNPSKLSRKLTRKYYKYHDYQAFFVSHDGLKQMATTLINKIKDDQVLKPNLHILFNLEKIELQLLKVSEDKNINELIKTDFMLISTYHRYMTYLSKGIINWGAFQKQLKSLDEEKEIIANWRKYNVHKNKRSLLYEAVKADDISIAIDKVNYTFPKAKELSELIKEFEELANNGGYIKVPLVKKSMKRGNYYSEIKQLRQRLIQSNDLKDNECYIEKTNEEKNLFQDKTTSVDMEKKSVEVLQDCQELFDDNVYQAVKSFQKSHGLVEDGIVGRNTIKRINIPVETKIKKMRINLERMRWMPRELGEKYLLVNIPDYNLKVYKEGEKRLEMPVVVGERRHPTPIFSHKVSTIVLNPYWRIPQRIVRREIIPKLVEDPTYLNRNEIKTFANWSHKSMEYDTTEIDWSMYLDNDLIGNTVSAPMRFIQIPGKKNPLGRMKFLFPNKYSVYLHDTPAKSLFKKRKRAFSHGCIRLGRPHDLLKTIAEDDIKIDYTKAKEILSDIEKTDFGLSKKIPVHIIYLTSWIDDEGKVQFRDDVYSYDKMHSKLIYNKSL